MKDKYSDLYSKEYHPSITHKHMDRLSRAAQFSPFAALTGYDAAILNASKLIVKQKTLTEDSKEELNEKLSILNRYKKKLIIKVTYYIDSKKIYETKIGEFLKINQDEKCLIFKDNTKISFSKIFSIESKIFNEFKIS